MMTLTVEVASDECDACPHAAHVRAYVYIELPSGRTLSMCGSHGNRHRTALLNQGAHIIDLTYLIPA